MIIILLVLFFAHLVNPSEISLAQKLFLCEKNATSPNLFKWVDGWDTKAVRTVASVDKKSALFIAVVHYKARQLVSANSDPKACAMLDERTILGNASGSWIAFGSQKGFPYDNNQTVWHVFFGDETSVLRYEWIDGRSTPLIRSLRRADGKSVFCVTSKGAKNFTQLIEPSNGEIWNINYKNMWESRHQNFNVGHLENTCARIINIPHWLVTECRITDIGLLGKFYARGEITILKDPVTIIKNSGQKPVMVDYTVDMQSKIFPAHWWDNLLTLFGRWERIVCACTTGSIDSECRKKYEKLCVIAQQEGAFEIKKAIQKDFVCRHILHEIKNYFSLDFTLYSNAFGKLAITANKLSQGDLRPFININNVDDNQHLNVNMQDIDAACTVFCHRARQSAQAWHEKQGLLYRCKPTDKGKDVYLFNLFELQKPIKESQEGSRYNVFKICLDSQYEIVDSYAEKDQEKNCVYLLLTAQNLDLCALARCHSWKCFQEEAAYYSWKDCIKAIHEKQDRCRVFYFHKNFAADAMQYVRNQYRKNEVKRNILELAKYRIRELGGAGEHFYTISDFVFYFDFLSKGGTHSITKDKLDVEALMDDPYYESVHTSIRTWEVANFKELVYAAGRVFNSCGKEHSLQIRLFRNIVVSVMAWSLYYGYYWSKYHCVLSLIAGVSSLLISSASATKKQYALYTIGELGCFYALSKLFSKSPVWSLSVPLVQHCGNALLNSIMPFKASVKIIWNSWPMAEYRRTLTSAKKQ